jgi:hypothetical protein
VVVVMMTSRCHCCCGRCGGSLFWPLWLSSSEAGGVEVAGAGAAVVVVVVVSGQCRGRGHRR